MFKKKHSGIRCAECGCQLDSGERCDCEKLKAEQAFLDRERNRRNLIARNREMLEQAFAEYDAC